MAWQGESNWQRPPSPPMANRTAWSVIISLLQGGAGGWEGVTMGSWGINARHNVQAINLPGHWEESQMAGPGLLSPSLGQWPGAWGLAHPPTSLVCLSQSHKCWEGTLPGWFSLSGNGNKLGILGFCQQHLSPPLAGARPHLGNKNNEWGAWGQ